LPQNCRCDSELENQLYTSILVQASFVRVHDEQQQWFYTSKALGWPSKRVQCDLDLCNFTSLALTFSSKEIADRTGCVIEVTVIQSLRQLACDRATQTLRKNQSATS
jgi:hypothetical protein